MEIWIEFCSWCNVSDISPLSSWVAGFSSHRTSFLWICVSFQDFENNFDWTESEIVSEIEIENTFFLENIET